MNNLYPLTLPFNSWPTNQQLQPVSSMKTGNRYVIRVLTY
jgi:hypothetical protein